MEATQEATVIVQCWTCNADTEMPAWAFDVDTKTHRIPRYYCSTACSGQREA